MRTKTISVRLTDDEVALLNCLSQREGRSKPDIIREALEPIYAGVVGYVCNFDERAMTTAQLSEESRKGKAAVGQTGVLGLWFEIG